MKKACEQCEERRFFARKFDMHFHGADCWYDCPYADDDPEHDIGKEEKDGKDL